MNAGTGHMEVVLSIEMPQWPLYGDLNNAYTTGILNTAYGRYHDPFLNIPLSRKGLPLIDPSNLTNPLLCTSRHDCNLWNNQYGESRLKSVVAANAGEEILPTMSLTQYSGYVYAPMRGGPVDPQWYDWTTPPPSAQLGKSAHSGLALPTETTVAPDGSTEDARELDPWASDSMNCTCGEDLEYNTRVKTIVVSAGASSVVTGLLCAAAGALAGGAAAFGHGEGGLFAGSEGEDESCDRIIAE